MKKLVFYLTLLLLFSSALTAIAGVPFFQENFYSFITGGVTSEGTVSFYIVEVIDPTDYNITVWIDGVETTEFLNAGEPYNLTVYVNDSEGNSKDVKLIIRECNSLAHFGLLQTVNTNLSNCVEGFTNTVDGFASLTVIPTGGDELKDDYLGNYSLFLSIEEQGIPGSNKTLSLSSRKLADPGSPKSLPSRTQIELNNDQVLRIFERVQRSFSEGYGDLFDLTIKDDNSLIGEFNPQSGRFAVLNLTFLEEGTENPIDGKIKIIESNSVAHWVLLQTGDSLVSNEVTLNASTGIEGNIFVVLIPTGGVPATVSDLGETDIRILGMVDEDVVFNHSFSYDNELQDPSPPLVDYPGKTELELMNDQILRIFERVQSFT